MAKTYPEHLNLHLFILIVLLLLQNPGEAKEISTAKSFNSAQSKTGSTQLKSKKSASNTMLSQVPAGAYQAQSNYRTPMQGIQNQTGPFYSQYRQQPQPPILNGGKLIVSTTENLPGYRIVSYKGLVRGDVVFGPTIIQSFKASIKSIVGGKLGGYTQMCQRARQNAFEDMLNQARQLGANAIVGIQYDSSTFRTSKDGDVGTEVFCFGTAVSIAPI